MPDDGRRTRPGRTHAPATKHDAAPGQTRTLRRCVASVSPDPEHEVRGTGRYQSSNRLWNADCAFSPS